MKAIELDENLMIAKSMLGRTYLELGEYDKAMDIYIDNYNQAEINADKKSMGRGLGDIGITYLMLGNNYEKAREYFIRSLDLVEEVNDKSAIASALNRLGFIHNERGDYDKQIINLNRSLKIFEELADDGGIGITLCNFSQISVQMGFFNEALEYAKRAMQLFEKIDYRREISICLYQFSQIYYYIGDYKKAMKYIKKAQLIKKQIGNLEFKNASLLLLYLIDKQQNLDYDKNKIHSIIKERIHTDFDSNFTYYQLLEDTSYLETAYNQVQKKADNLEPDVAAKSLSYPIPKAIVEEWEKVTTNKN